MGLWDSLSGAKNYILGTVANAFLNPIYTGVLRAGAMVVGLIGLLFLGSDLQLGQSGTVPDVPFLSGTGMFTGDFLGIADLPVYLGQLLIDAVAPIGAALLMPIRGFNAAIATTASNIGLAGPPVLFAMQIAELAAGLYVLSVGAQVAIGYVAPGLAGKVSAVVTLPLRWFS